MASAPITLYLDIPEGQHGDLEVVAEASIAWARTIKDVARVLYPDLTIRVEVLDADEGSFGLNARIQIDPKFKAALIGILAGAATHFGLETVDYFYEKFLDSIFGDSPPAQAVAAEERERVASAVARGAGKKPAEQVYRALQTDPVIKGVGVSPRPEQQPSSVIERGAFLVRGGYMAVENDDRRERTRPERIEAVLIKPVLVPRTRRLWRFQTPSGEFSFMMKDHAFVGRLLDGTEPIPMVAGVILDVDVEVTEVFAEGLWQPKARAITRVWGHRFDASALLPFGEDDDED
ncbi:hypothetical protein KOAAANKH_03526 [Brevundimonas sp. NIBR10]|uniref:hypothetical protein n=1 Tax=Brevundimonas sp. NIBR10 TaxID=3015997 RepID=UPI0022F1A1BD|nr:hypothetical protein [Brevundimonas sp. NIBR10]WGM48623.1 hypothetical protein KOAAANKH_03526 [Brevundimonas sp. NIBR10]